MSSLKIIITGAVGNLGQYTSKLLAENHKVYGLYRNTELYIPHVDFIQFDLLEFDRLEKLFKNLEPDIVIHFAAMSSASAAELGGEEIVEKTNVEATRKIAELCYTLGAKLIFTSTDQVYDGEIGSMLDETAKVNPITLYSQTKLKAEDAIKETFDNFVILRTALLFGLNIENSLNFFQYIFNEMKAGRKVNVFYDQYRTPLLVNKAANMIEEIIDKDLRGIYNFGGADRVSRYDMALAIAKFAKLDVSLITKVSLSEKKDIQQVRDVSMNTDKLKNMGISIPGFEDSVKYLFKI